jgi:membrane protease YdiL (CAAX protease family)
MPKLPVACAILALILAVCAFFAALPQAPPPLWWLLFVCAAPLLTAGVLWLRFAWKVLNKPKPPRNKDKEEARRQRAKIAEERNRAWLSVFFGIPSTGGAVGVFVVLVFTSGVLGDGNEQPAPQPGQKETTPDQAPPHLQMMERAGQFGDTFGLVNAMFSALAFAGILYTLHLQRRELELQRTEMRRARGEAKRTADTAIRTAIVSAISALWEHHDAVEKSTLDHEHTERTKQRKIKLELTTVLQNLIWDITASNSIHLRDEESIRDQVRKLHESITRWIPRVNPGGDKHAKLSEVKEGYATQLDYLLGCIRLHIHPNSPAGTCVQCLFTLRNAALDFYKVKASPEDKKQASLDWLREVASALQNLASASFKASLKSAQADELDPSPKDA